MKLLDFDGFEEKLKRPFYSDLYNQYKGYILSRSTDGKFRSRTVDELEGAICYSFLYFVEKNELYAKRAANIIKQQMLDKKFKTTKGLFWYRYLYIYSMCYQFCKGAKSWEKIEKRVSMKIKELAEWSFFDGGSEQNQDPSSNWKALRYSAAGLGYMATDEPVDHLDGKVYGCYMRARKYIYSNFGGGFGGQEGDGYCRLSWGILGPFGIALKKNYGWLIDDADDYEVEYQFMWSLGHMVPIQSSKELFGISPDFVTDSPPHDSSKFMGLACYYLDEEHQAGLNTVIKSKFDENGKFKDRMDSGVIYILLYHDDDYGYEDPLGNETWRESFEEVTGNGYLGFRNRFKDKNDIVAQIYANQRNHNGHTGPDQGGFRIIGLGNIWAIGGGWCANKDVNGIPWLLRSANTVFPGGRGGPGAHKLWKPFNNRGTIFKEEKLDSASVEGYAIIGANHQNDFDTERLKRRFITKFDVDEAAAAFIVSDTSLNGRYWQLSTLQTNEVEISGNSFIIRDLKNGTSMKGTVLHPTGNYVIRTGERMRGTDFFLNEEQITHNKYILIERTDKIPGWTKNIEIDRGKRNSLLYSRTKEGLVPNYKVHDGDFTVVLTLCECGSEHPEVELVGSRVHSGITVKIGSYETTIDYENVRMGE